MLGWVLSSLVESTLMRSQNSRMNMLGCVMAGLHIGKEKTGPDHFVTVEEIVTEHWKEYGRNYYTR